MLPIINHQLSIINNPISLIDEIENIDDNKNRETNNNRKMTHIPEEPEEDSEDVYSKVYESHTAHDEDQSRLAPRAAVRRKKRRELDEKHRQAKNPAHARHVSFDWLSGTQRGDNNSQVAVLKNMVYKLSVELGKEQNKMKKTGAQLTDVEARTILRTQ